MRLTIEQIIEYQTKGFVIVEDVLTDEDFKPMIDELNEIIDRLAKEFHAAGKITNLHKDAPFERRLFLLKQQCPEMSRWINNMIRRRKEMFNFLRNDNLLDVVECLLGSEIMCNPIQHLRPKMPTVSGEAQVNDYSNSNLPWHQDAAVQLEESDSSEIITFWIPLVNATKENGCMELIPDVARFGLLQHQAEGSTMIVPDQMPTNEPILGECRKGGIVIMNKYCPHRSTTNTSDHIRWTLDLRYHKIGANSGRPTHPSFVVRSHKDPKSVLTDYEEWCRLWDRAAIDSRGKKMHRV